MKCKVRLSYNNQCVAMADPVGEFFPGAITTANNAATIELARVNALKQCQGVEGQKCAVFYSACGLSEYEQF